MPTINGRQIRNGGVQKEDLDTTTPSKAVITKVIAGTNISISQDGVDSGTGEVTINALNSLPNGGTSKQILVKNSATNGDASWATQSNVVDNLLPDFGRFNNDNNTSIPSIRIRVLK